MSAPVLESRRLSPGRLVGFVLLLSGVSLGLCVFSAFPWTGSPPGAAVVRVAFKHVGAYEQAAAALSPEEVAKLPRHMRPTSQERARTGRRVESHLVVAVDGRRLLDRLYRPGGWRHDGPTFGYEEILVSLGRHRIDVTLADGQPGEESDKPRRWLLTQEVDITSGRALLVEFSEDAGLTLR